MYSLPDDHPLMLALLTKDPSIVSVGVDDVYVLIVRLNENGTPEGVRYAKSHEIREALAAHERGEAIAPGAYQLLPPRLKMNETEE